MVNKRQGDLEARVARLERLLDRVLDLVQELKAGQESEPLSDQKEIPWEVMRAVGATASEPVDTIDEEVVGPVAAETGLEEREGLPMSRRDSVPPKPVEPAPAAASSEPVSGQNASATFRPGAWQDDSKQLMTVLSDLGIWPPTETFLSRVGIAILLLSVAFFFKYSIDQGWLIPAVRIAIGVAAGLALVVMGFKGASKGEPLGTALAGGGIATFFITGFTAHQWYSLVSYPVAFGFLFAASALGIYLSLRSGLQALAIVGLIGALATPLLLTARTAEVAGLALYVCLIVASVAAIYMFRAWRALFLLAVVTAWLVMAIAVDQAGQAPGASGWVVQGGIFFCALAFWLVPLFRAELRAGSPGRWLRPESAFPEGLEPGERVPPAPGPSSWFDLQMRSAAGTVYVPWNVHLDTLSLLIPLVAIALTLELWTLTQAQAGWVFLGAALLAQSVGWWISRSHDPEDSASTQWFVAILLSTVGLGMVLSGDFLYLAFIAEAAALLAVGARRRSKVVMGLGAVVELLVLGLFLLRLVVGGSFLEGDLSPVLDLAAIGGAVFIGLQMQGSKGKRTFFIGAYLAALAFTASQLAEYPTVLYLAFLAEAVATQAFAARRADKLHEGLAYVAFGLVAIFFASGFESGPKLLAGDPAVLVDLGAILGAVFMGIRASRVDLRRAFLASAYLGFLALLGRELADHTTVLYLTFILAAVLTQVLAERQESSLFSNLAHIPALVLMVFFASGMETGRNLVNGDATSFVDLAAVGAVAFVGTRLSRSQGGLVYLFGAYAGLLLWTGRELYPLEQGQALMSLAFGVEGATLLVAGFLMDRPLLQKTGMATLLLVVVKVLLVDLAAVEPIWRVLLLFVVGGLFLLLSKFIKGRRSTPAHSGS